MQPHAFDEAMRILQEAKAKGVTLRLLGGTAILSHCPSANGGILARPGKPDVDLAGFKEEAAGIKEVLQGLGHTPNQAFNAIHGYKQMLFHGPGGEPKVDVFLDEFSMCHRLDLKPRLGLASPTLPLADLLFTKLQVIQINEKDLRDIVTLLHDHELGSEEGPERVDGAYLAGIAAGNWGIYTTLTDNLAKVREFLPQLNLETPAGAIVRERIERLQQMLDVAPKSMGWRLRSKVGRRLIWYELPEEPKTIRLGQG